MDKLFLTLFILFLDESWAFRLVISGGKESG
jgi:hypothetical protein